MFKNNRRDGKRVKKLDGVHSIIPFMKPRRSNSDVYINYSFDVSNIVKYIDDIKSNNPNMTYFHIFSAAIAKLIYERPLLNRFVINKKYYDRNQVRLSFVAKEELNDESSESLSVIEIAKSDNLMSISEKIFNVVHRIRNESRTNDTDRFINKIGKLPKFFKSIIWKLITFLDNHDMLPKSLTENSIYHSSVILSNLGSIGCDAIYHNLTDFGTNSILITIGEIKKELVVLGDTLEPKYTCNFGINIDERIADGYYFVKSLKKLQEILNNPSELEKDFNV